MYVITAAIRGDARDTFPISHTEMREATKERYSDHHTDKRICADSIVHGGLLRAVYSQEERGCNMRSGFCLRGLSCLSTRVGCEHGSHFNKPGV